MFRNVLLVNNIRRETETEVCLPLIYVRLPSNALLGHYRAPLLVGRSKLKTDSPSNSLDVSHIGTKDFRYGHGSIGVLVLFDDRDQHPGARNRRVVQRITKT
jgi:hypothetical protein